MKHDLHHWLNKKTSEKVSVRIVVGAKPSVGKPMASKAGDDPPGLRFPRTEADKGKGAMPRLMNATERFNAAPGKGEARWPKRGPLVAMAIVGGAVMVGLLMGWTVWTLMLPLPTG